MFARLGDVTTRPPQTPADPSSDRRAATSRSALLRRAARLAALVPALAVTGLAGTAVADPPAQWQDAPGASPLSVLLLLGGVPLALFLVITLLVYLPSMSRTHRYEPGQAWRNEPEWFGGPRGGLQDDDQPAVAAGDDERGGASGRW